MMAEAARTMQAGTGIDDPVHRLVRRLEGRYKGRITGGVVLPERPALSGPLRTTKPIDIGQNRSTLYLTSTLGI
jgi:hypothetical protein